MASSSSKNETGVQGWHNTTLRVRHLDESIGFYQKHFHMSLVHVFQGEKAWAALVTQRSNNEPRDIYFKGQGVSLVLREVRGLKEINNGNKEPNRGFGHIAFNCNDVYATCKHLEDNGVQFQKKPDEGRMKGLAFALDVDGYWIEIIGRGGNAQMPEPFNLSQTMIRVKDPHKSLAFYRTIMGMSLVREMPCSDFTNFFLTSSVYANVSLPKNHNTQGEEARDVVHKLWTPCLELTHNHGTEDDPNFHYHNGCKDPKGFSNLSFAVDDVADFVAKAKKIALDNNICNIEATEIKNPESMCLPQDVLFIHDPDGYRVLIFGANHLC